MAMMRSQWFGTAAGHPGSYIGRERDRRRLLGSGFIGDTYADALQDVRNARARRHLLARPRPRAPRWPPSGGRSPRQYDDMAALCADPAVDLVVIALPNEAHLEAVRVAAAARQGRGVHQAAGPDRRGGRRDPAHRPGGAASGTATRRARSSRPNIAKAHEMVAAGAHRRRCSPCGPARPTPGPHAPHFWDAETAGGGALLDMGCHTVESARHFFGKDNPITEVFAWGATLAHGDRTTGEDTADRPAEVRRRPARHRRVVVDREGRHAVAARTRRQRRAGSSPTPPSTPVWGFIEHPAGYLVEKADADTGWVYPVPEEARAYGFSQQMRHFVDRFAGGRDAARDLRGRPRRQPRPGRLLRARCARARGRRCGSA